MKFAVLISVLIASCLGAVKHSVRVRGFVSCSKPFYYSVNLWDNLKHDLLGNLETFQLSPNMSAYEIFRTDWGGWYERQVVPVMTIEHSCGEANGCVCKDFRERTWREIDSLYAGSEDVNLAFKTTELAYCDFCQMARKARGLFLNRKMKLIVLISVLTTVLCKEYHPVEVQVTVRGTLTCSAPFHYRISLWEEDNFSHDLFGKLKTTQSTGNSATYEVSGMGTESKNSVKWGFEKAIEPVMTIEHSCGAISSCVCKDLGDPTEDVELTVDLNLEKPGLEHCSFCDLAQDQRGKE